MTFAGNTQATVREHSRRRAACRPSAGRSLARTRRLPRASRDDPCSNALLEALACGLPAAYLRSGGHPELVGEAGIGFDEPEELPAVLARLRGRARRAPCRDPCAVARRGGRPLSRGAARMTASCGGVAAPSRHARRVRAGADRVVAGGVAALRRRRRLRLVDRRRPRAPDRDSAATRATTSRPRAWARFAKNAGRLPPRPLRRAAAALARVVAPARAQLLPRAAGHGRLSRVRSRLRDADDAMPRASTVCR